MENDILFIATILLEFFAIGVSARLGKEWLFGTIIINIILISVFGAKLASVFGLTTNVGNVFFAAVFLATHILVERFGRHEGYKTAWMGFGAIIFFVSMAQFTLGFQTVPQTADVAEAMTVIFGNTPRIALASMIGFLFVQHVNVWLYARLKQATAGRHLWFRDNVANFAGQLVDSVMFFSIAFYGTIPFSVLLETMLVGFVFKIAVGVLGTGVLYGSAFFASGEDEPR